MQYFFNTEYQFDPKGFEKELLVAQPTKQEVQNIGFSSTMKLSMIPIQKSNRVMVRITNLGDHFDTQAKETSMIDLN